MKHFALIIVAALIMIACGTSKKVVTKQDVVINTEQQDTNAVVSVHDVVIDTMWWDSGVYTHTIITFEPDTMSPQVQPHNDTLPVVEPNTGTKINVGGLSISLPGAMTIKSIDNTTLERNTGGKVNKTENDSVSNVSASHNVTNIAEHKEESKTPVNVVRPWKIWLLAALVLAILLLILFNRTKICNWAKRVWTFARMFI